MVRESIVSSPLFNSIQGANFEDPGSPDQTSAPALPQAPQMPEQNAANPLAKVLAAKKQRKPKVSPQLTAAIARGRRAKPSAEKFG